MKLLLSTLLFSLFAVSCVEKPQKTEEQDFGQATIGGDLSEEEITSLEKEKKKSVVAVNEVAEVGLEDDDGAQLVSLEITPSVSTLPIGIDHSFKAIGIFENGSRSVITNKVEWFTENQITGQFAGKDTPGILSTLSLGPTKIFAALNGFQASQEIEISPIRLERIEVTPKVILAGTKQKLYAVAIYNDGSKLDITEEVIWESNDQTIGAIDSTGNKLEGIAPGSVSVKANYQNASGGVALIEVRLKKLISMELEYLSNVAVIGTSIQFGVKGIFEDDTVETITNIVTWSSSKPEIFELGNGTDSGGKLQAKGVGKAVLKAELDGIIVELSVDIIVTQFDHIKIVADSNNIPLGLIKNLKAMGVSASGEEQEISENAIWNSSNEDYLTVSNITGESGQITALAKGISVISIQYGNFSDAIPIQVTDPAVVELVIGEVETEYICGIDFPILTVIGKYSDDTEADLSALVTWTSETPESLTVSNSPADRGTVTSTEIGPVVIHVVYNEVLTGLEIASEVTVNTDNPQILDGVILPSYASVAIGLPVQYLYFMDYSCGENIDVTEATNWSSSDVSVLTIDNTDGTRGNASTFGSTASNIIVTITAIANTTESTFNMEIRPQEVIAVVVQANDIGGEKFEIAETSQFTAFASYSNGDLFDETLTAEWSTQDTAYATVDNGALKGLATGVKEKKKLSLFAQITKPYGTFSGSKVLKIESICPAGGTKVGIYCVYLGAGSTNCTTTCAAQGATNHNATNDYFVYHQSASQNCLSAFTKLGFVGTLKESNATQPNNKGLACSMYENVGLGLTLKYQFIEPAPSFDEADTDFRRVCACTHAP